MKPKDIFDLIIRLLGIVFLYQALQQVPLAFSSLMMGIRTHTFVGIFTGLMMVGWPLAIAYWLLRGAQPITRIAYPEKERTPLARATEPERVVSE